jgi:hypothetical protein
MISMVRVGLGSVSACLVSAAVNCRKCQASDQPCPLTTVYDSQLPLTEAPERAFAGCCPLDM